MTSTTHQPPREDVLNAFAVEQDFGRETLERYLRDFPQYATDLIDLSSELSRGINEQEGELSEEDQKLINKAWTRYQSAIPKVTLDPLAALSVPELRELAGRLEVPRQVITAFRERRVIVDSVPQRFLSQFAIALNSTVERLVSAFAMPPLQGLTRSYKADVKPQGDSPITFEQLLMDAGVSEEKRNVLMADDD